MFVRVTAAVLLAKAYTLLLLYVIFLRVNVRPDYTPFLYRTAGQSREARIAEVDRSFAQRLAPLDGQFYLDIAARGYRKFEARGRWVPEGNYAFFPLLPWVLNALGFPRSPGAVTLALALHLALGVAAAVGLWVLARRVRAPPWLSVGLLLSYPFAIFQSALYTEALYLFLAVFTSLGLVGSRHRRWFPVLTGYLGGLCRPQGVLLSVLSISALSADWSERRARRKTVAAVLAPVAGLATFAVVLWVVIDRPLGFVEIQSNWGRGFAPGKVLAETFGFSTYEGPPLDRLGVLLGVGLLPFLWRHLPAPLALYGTAAVVLPLASGSILSFGRFLSVSFPHFLCLAIVLRKWKVASFFVLASFLLLQTLVAAGIVGWRFVG